MKKIIVIDNAAGDANRQVQYQKMSTVHQSCNLVDGLVYSNSPHAESFSFPTFFQRERCRVRTAAGGIFAFKREFQGGVER